MMVALISPTFSLSRIRDVLLAVENRLPRFAHAGRAERVGLRAASRAAAWSSDSDFSSGLSDQRGVNEGFWLILLAVEKTCQMPLAAIDSPFSTYFIGACMRLVSSVAAGRSRPGSRRWCRLSSAQVLAAIPEMIGRDSAQFGGFQPTGIDGAGRARWRPVGWHVRLEFGAGVQSWWHRYVDEQRALNLSDHCISLMLRRSAQCADHGQPRNGLPPAGAGSVRPADEHDACGVGFVVHMKGAALARHRAQGAAGPDQSRAPRRLRLRGQHRRRRRHPDPDARRVPAQGRRRSRCRLPGAYGAGLVFLPHDERDRDAIKALIARIVDEEGQTLLGWRDVPTDNTLVGASARADAAASSSRCSSARRHAGRPTAARAPAVRAQAVRHPQARRARRRRAEDQRARRAASSTSSACRPTR